MQMSQIKVTPELAEQWLAETNTNNRKLSKATVSKYAADMEAGAWHETSQNVIGFYEDGSLADGQHRLAAIVQAGSAVSMWVANGIAKSGAAVIDQGRKRSVVDAMTISGLVDMPHYMSWAVGIVRLIRSAEANTPRGLSISGTADAINALREGIDFVCENMASAPKGIGNASCRAAVAVAYYHLPAHKLRQFCRVLVSGMPEADGDVTIIKLRNNLLTDSASNNHDSRVAKYRLTQKFVKLYCDGKVMSIVRPTGDITYTSGLFDGE